MARPKLTPAVHDAIVKLVGNGAFVEVACESVGIAKGTYYGWLKRGQDPSETDSRYRTFLDATTRARAEFENRTLGHIGAAMAPHWAGKVVDGEKVYEWDWKAAAWLLERLFPTRYSNMRKVELTGAGGGPITLAGLEALMGIDAPEDDDA